MIDNIYFNPIGTHGLKGLWLCHYSTGARGLVVPKFYEALKKYSR